MELKQFQQRALKQVGFYLRHLLEWKAKADANPELEINFPERAWVKSEAGGQYHSKLDGLKRHMPNFCLKVPTGGGKTLLAIKMIDLVNLHYRQKKSGLVLWVVPTQQIYQQTLKALRDKDHPYRQHLDLIAGGRTQIIEKGDKFTPLDVRENLVVLMLMLPSANRQNRETLKIFQDSGGFEMFFPPEDAAKEQEAWLEKIPNLDHFGSKENILGRQIKTSLGNTLRILNPIIILDEGHKAYGELAQATLAAFNPSIILELSATPKPTSNKLVIVTGRELEREEMLKLDLRITNDNNWDWRTTLAKAITKRNDLEKLAQAYDATCGRYIRPILLIQVERTGKDQRDDGRHTHAEQIKEHLMRVEGISEAEIAIKSSAKDDLDNIDDDDGLLSRHVPIRYIITKYALQEGWDCPFAYVLAILTNAGAQTALTQLVGRILRQPHARKTGVLELDESYVFAYQQQPTVMLEQIKKGFESEGLGDLAGKLTLDRPADDDSPNYIVSAVRERFQKAVSAAFLPVFACRDSEKNEWRPVRYSMDIERHIDWQKVDLSKLFELPLSAYQPVGETFAIGLGQNARETMHMHDVQRVAASGADLDPFYLSRVLSDDLVPNPWEASRITEAILDGLQKQHGGERVASRFVYIVEQAKQHIQAEKDRLAHQVFSDGLDKDLVRFTILSNADLFKPRKVKDTKRLTDRRGQPLQRSLFDPEIEEDYDSLEQQVAWFLEEQNQLFFWWRNVPRTGYHLQAWRRNKIFPDFVFSADYDGDNFKAYVVETKGNHLAGNDDTEYKKAVFSMANEKSKAMKLDVGKLGQAIRERKTRYAVIQGDRWQAEFEKLLHGAA